MNDNNIIEYSDMFFIYEDGGISVYRDIQDLRCYRDTEYIDPFMFLDSGTYVAYGTTYKLVYTRST